MSKRVAIVCNLSAGGARSGKIQNLLTHLSADGHHVMQVNAANDPQLKNFKPDVVIAAGGDGTIRQTINDLDTMQC